MADSSNSTPAPGANLAALFDVAPKSALIALLSAVRTLDQLDEWVEDWKTSRHLLTYDDQVEVAVFGGFRKVDIIHGNPLREFC